MRSQTGLVEAKEEATEGQPQAGQLAAGVLVAQPGQRMINKPIKFAATSRLSAQPAQSGESGADTGRIISLNRLTGRAEGRHLAESATHGPALAALGEVTSAGGQPELDQPGLKKRRIKNIVPYFGGKSGTIGWLIASRLPPHKIYLEPFGGAAGVLLAKAPSHTEIYVTFTNFRHFFGSKMWHLVF